MNTKIIMTTSASVLGAAGILLIFMPEEFLRALNFDTLKSLQLLVQTVGALYFAFAMMNWMIRTSTIGGIYNRPIVVGNVTHFSIAGLALIKGAFSHSDLSAAAYIAAGGYTIFAILFGILLFRNPAAADEK